TGYVDYVLWDDDGTPLALVEAKSTLKNATTGENQAQLYAEALEKMHGRRPVMYYTNGFDTFVWDDQFYKKARKVHGFYTKAELQTLMFRRDNRKDIRKAEIDIDIAGRPYQMRSIKSIAEHFAGNDKRTGELIGTNRGALLVLATGTGKTRTSIAFSKIMLQSNWAKRILFLADRVSLVKQAKSNFVKLLPEHASVNLIEEKDNPDARIAFSTYQTMMGLIDKSRDGDSRFYGVGHFDLIIVDEAHRSIYQKYYAIFEYFDALYLGLTATPKDSIDKNTYSIFDLPDKTPTDAYDFDEAVAEKHLVPYHTIDVPTKFHTEGIRYEDLSEEEKAAFEDEILEGGEATGNEWIEPSQMNEWLFNKDTVVKVLSFILEKGIKKRGGEELGKTIFFAKNQKHAHFLKDMLLDMDKERFSNDYVKVITHSEPKSQEFIERFCDEEKDRLPQIAISVDMMDTGIDAPSCVNLVFYKPVRSYAKFWQMIGRGSRLRPDLFGPGKNKTHYLIFDLFENFKFFNENPKGIETSSQISLTAQVFNLKLQLADYLGVEAFRENEEFQSFRKELLDDLHNEIASLDTDRFDVKMKLKTVMDFGINQRAVWDSLSKKEIHTIQQELAVLVQTPKGDSDLARFYDKRLYLLMLNRLETPDSDLFKTHFKTPISKVITLSIKLERKVNIPVVKENIALIQAPLEETFWEEDGIQHLEKIRSGIRDLLKYIDPEDERYVTTDYEDVLGEATFNTNPRAAEEDNEYINPFASTAKRLEQLINENKDNLTISRIRKGEKITQEELAGLEDILFT
ncbi:MAG TPA: DEAD/DEAH box helicase family protein, partial [Brumimicrobium sp.]|nr:DEAD/DEAH box helicase family protein [Brumimicrobium sp.]